MALSDYALRNNPTYGGTSDEETVTYHYRVPSAAGWKTSFVPAYKATATDAELGTVYF